jgi:thiol-disulfide isomerase/thioredoxin
MQIFECRQKRKGMNKVSKARIRMMATIAVIGLSGLLVTSCTQADAPEAQTTSKPAATDAPATAAPQATESAPRAVGSFLSLADYQAAASDYSGTKVVLFFNASWCSTCKIARDNFQASLDEIPGDMTIVEVDFDDSQDLRTTYGVTIQHTFVQIDDNGEGLKKWSGSMTIDDLVKQTA